MCFAAYYLDSLSALTNRWQMFNLPLLLLLWSVIYSYWWLVIVKRDSILHGVVKLKHTDCCRTEASIQCKNKRIIVLLSQCQEASVKLLSFIVKGKSITADEICCCFFKQVIDSLICDHWITISLVLVVTCPAVGFIQLWCPKASHTAHSAKMKACNDHILAQTPGLLSCDEYSGDTTLDLELTSGGAPSLKGYF